MVKHTKGFKAFYKDFDRSNIYYFHLSLLLPFIRPQTHNIDDFLYLHQHELGRSHVFLVLAS